MLPAVILAGGRGSRLAPLTNHWPKALSMVQGGALLDHLIWKLQQAGVSSIFVTCGYMSDEMVRYIEDIHPDCVAIGASANAVTPEDAILLASDFVQEDFLLIHGDHWFSQNPFPDLIKNHHSGEITHAVQTLANSTAAGWDNQRVIDRASRRILDLEEPGGSDHEQVRLVDGCMILPKQIFGIIERRKLAGLPQKGMRELFAYTIRNQLSVMRGVMIPGWWENINDLNALGKTIRRISDESLPEENTGR
jgi:NDP-sugar pyrophosphorylase family protein